MLTEKLRINSEILNNLITSDIVEKIVQFSVKLCYLKKFDIEAICFFIKQTEMKFKPFTAEDFSQFFFWNFDILTDALNEDLKTLSICDNEMVEFSTYKHSNLDKFLNLNKNQQNIPNLDKLKEYAKEKNIYSVMDHEQGIIVK